MFSLIWCHWCVQVLNPRCVSPKEDSGEGRQSETPKLSHITHLACSEVHWKPSPPTPGGATSGVLTATLSWINHHYTVDPIHHCNVYMATRMTEGEFTSAKGKGSTPNTADKEVKFIGRAHSDQFVVAPFTVHEAEQKIRFYVQPVTTARRLLPWQQCPSVTIMLD